MNERNTAIKWTSEHEKKYVDDSLARMRAFPAKYKRRIELIHRSLNRDKSQEFIRLHHRHSKPLKRHMFSIGAFSPIAERLILGVATIDHCSSKYNQRRDHIEISRVCVRPDVDAGNNVASFLIGKACQAVFAMGYRVIITYSQPHESGASRKAAGFCIQEQTKGGLIRWIKIRGQQATSCEREFTNRVLEANRKFLTTRNPNDHQPTR